MSRQVFRSPAAVAVWWIWVLFAAGNLIDLAVQGRDRVSLVAAFVLLAVTGVMYVAAWRPRIVADGEGLTIVNPLRAHQVRWAAVAGIDEAGLIRVRCEWAAGPGEREGRKAIYAWAGGSSGRPQVMVRPRAAGSGDADKIVAALTARADKAASGSVPSRSAATVCEVPAAGPVSTWCWSAFAIAGVPVLALLAVLAV